MTRPLILASASEVRANILRRAGLTVTVIPARIDEAEIKRALAEQNASPADVADCLAETKAVKVARKAPDALVLGCDQVLDLDGTILSKPQSLQDASDQITLLRGRTHHLRSALVLYDGGQPVWRHIGTARLTMRELSDAYRDAYLSRNWPGLSTSVGGYKYEEEGIRLFNDTQGDYFTILGLPLLPLLAYLSQRGFIET